MNDEELLIEMRRRIEADASGNSVANLVKEQKEVGLRKSDAQRLLTLLMKEYQEILPRTQAVEAREDAIAEVLDRVVGWCSHDHIYSDE